MNKTIWIYWHTGYNTAPEICKACYNSWVEKNPDWNVIMLCDDNMEKYIPLKEWNRVLRYPTKTNHSELIRLYLIGRYGGVYTDITNYCIAPIDDWLKPGMLVDDSWFHWDYNSDIPTFNYIYTTRPGHEKYMHYYDLMVSDEELRTAPGYLRMVFRFTDLIQGTDFIEVKNKQIGRSSNSTTPKQGTKIIANCHKLMNQPVDQNFREAVSLYPFFKLTWKFENNDIPLESRFRKNSKLLYLLSYKS